MANLKITAVLCSPLAGEPPKLDAILQLAMAIVHGKRPEAGGRKLLRTSDLSELPDLPMPILRRRLGPWSVAACSDPIIAVPPVDGVDHVNKRLDPANADMLAESSLRKINTSGGPLKSYRLPMRARPVDRIVWFAVGDRKGVLKALDKVSAVGKKTSIGYGRVGSWEAESIESDLSWFAPLDDGRPLLMRTLPAGDWLPADLVGARKDYGACCPPYWHPDRYTEVVVPC